MVQKVMKADEALYWVEKILPEDEIQKYAEYAVTDFGAYGHLILDGLYGDDEDDEDDEDGLYKGEPLPDNFVGSQSRYKDSNARLAYLGKYHKGDMNSTGGEFPKGPEVFYYRTGPDYKRYESYELSKEMKDGYKEITIRGWGQCGHFARKSFDHLTGTKGRPADLPQPSIARIGQKSEKHNWTVVNFDLSDTSKHTVENDERICVDLWMYAMGAPYEHCICTLKQVHKEEVKVFRCIDAKGPIEYGRKEYTVFDWKEELAKKGAPKRLMTHDRLVGAAEGHIASIELHEEGYPSKLTSSVDDLADRLSNAVEEIMGITEDMVEYTRRQDNILMNQKLRIASLEKSTRRYRRVNQNSVDNGNRRNRSNGSANQSSETNFDRNRQYYI